MNRAGVAFLSPPPAASQLHNWRLDSIQNRTPGPEPLLCMGYCNCRWTCCATTLSPVIYIFFWQLSVTCLIKQHYLKAFSRMIVCLHRGERPTVFWLHLTLWWECVYELWASVSFLRRFSSQMEQDGYWGHHRVSIFFLQCGSSHTVPFSQVSYIKLYQVKL